MNVSGAKDSTESYETCSASELTDATPVSVYAADRDTSAMAFPCLSFCSFQLAGDTLHMVAQYRYQYLIQRGYGNYLGLGQLLGYVCLTVGLKPGEIDGRRGRCAADAPRYQVARLTASAQAQ